MVGMRFTQPLGDVRVTRGCSAEFSCRINRDSSRVQVNWRGPSGQPLRSDGQRCSVGVAAPDVAWLRLDGCQLVDQGEYSVSIATPTTEPIVSTARLFITHGKYTPSKDIEEKITYKIKFHFSFIYEELNYFSANRIMS